MKHLLCLEINGAQMYATVMELVERNKDIVVTKAEFVTDKRRNLRSDSGHKRNRLPESRSEMRFLAHLKSIKQSGDPVNTAEAEEWCLANGLAKTSASSICSYLAKYNHLKKDGLRKYILLK